MLATALTLAAVLSTHTGFAWSAPDAGRVVLVTSTGRTLTVGIYGHTTTTDAIRKADWLIRTYGN